MSLFYGLEGDEALERDIETIVERYIDIHWPALPTTLTVLHFNPRRAADAIPCNWLDHLLEAMGEELDYEEAWRPTAALLEAKAEFERVLVAEYDVRMCEPSGARTTVDLREWLATHDAGLDGEPEWIGDDNAEIPEPQDR